MAIGVEWPLESIRHVEALSVALRCHGLGCAQAAYPGSAQEIEAPRAIRADPVKLALQVSDEVAIRPAVWKALPLHEQHPLSDGCQIWQPYERPFCSCPHIDQNRPLVFLKARPDVLDGRIPYLSRLTVTHNRNFAPRELKEN